MFSLCESMKWSHLPEPGGIYAQDPELIRLWRTIFYERGEFQREEEKQRKLEMERKERSMGSGRR
jgi:hypothetical protein